MMYFQEKARRLTPRPIMLSALSQLPSVTAAYAEHEQIAIFTANEKSLQPMHDLIKKWCAVNTDEDRYVIVGCEDVPGFEAVAAGEKVDVAKVEPGMVAKALQVKKEHPTLRAFLLECSEMPPYADAIRAATGLPVYDAITGVDFMVSGRRDNARFGKLWQKEWDFKQVQYEFAQELTPEQREKLVNKSRVGEDKHVCKATLLYNLAGHLKVEEKERLVNLIRGSSWNKTGNPEEGGL